MDLLEKIAGNNQPAVHTVYSHPSKIDVVKFDGTDNFGMRRCKVMGALTMSNVEDSLCTEEKSEKTSKKDLDKMNRTSCGFIRSFLTQDIKYHVIIKTSVKKI